MTYKGKEFKKITDDLIKYRRKGMSKQNCAAMVGISRHTLNNWLERGESKNSKYHDFYLRFEKAKAELVYDLVDIIDEVIYQDKKKGIEYAFKYLKILEPDYYNTERKIKTEVNQKQRVSAKQLSSNIRKALMWINENNKSKDISHN